MYDNVAIIILAAGVSKRLGRPKQLELYKGKSLLQHTIDTAIATNVKSIMVVLGARYELIQSHITHNDLIILKNENWEQGMSTSIVCGLTYITDNSPNVDKVIFMVCDQPYVNTTLLNDLIQKNQDTKMPIIASEYLDIKGTPALFDKEIFHSLMKLEGEGGAGKIIKQYTHMVASVPFEKGEVDVDREGDLEGLD
jgi:molybdenum cofactor cytidylyltransferase